MSSWRKGSEAQKHVETSESHAFWCIISNTALQHERADMIPGRDLLITVCYTNHPKLPVSATTTPSFCWAVHPWCQHAFQQYGWSMHPLKPFTLAKSKYQHYQPCVFSLSDQYQLPRPQQISIWEWQQQISVSALASPTICKLHPNA